MSSLSAVSPDRDYQNLLNDVETLTTNFPGSDEAQRTALALLEKVNQAISHNHNQASCSSLETLKFRLTAVIKSEGLSADQLLEEAVNSLPRDLHSTLFGMCGPLHSAIETVRAYSDLIGRQNFQQLYPLMTNGIESEALVELNAKSRKSDLALYQDLALLRQDISLRRAWTTIRTTLLEKSPKTTVPQERASLAEIRAWLDDKKNQPLLEGIERLNLSGQGLLLIPKEIRSLSNLKTLDLERNMINVLCSGDFAFLQKLEILNLGGNELFQVHLQNLPCLRRLKLGFNQLSHAVLKDLPQLQELDLDDNQIIHLTLEGLPELQWLDLTKNKPTEVNIGRLPKMIKNLHLIGNSSISERIAREFWAFKKR